MTAPALAFGTTVQVRAVVQRCRGETATHVAREPIFLARIQRTRRDGGYLRVDEPDDAGSDWPGHSIPDGDDYLLEPGTQSRPGIYVRLRRLAYHGSGLVVGHTWRCEGRLVPTERSFGEYGSEIDEGGLLDQRRVPLIQVAFSPITRPDGPARVAFVWHEDLAVTR